MGQLTLPTSGPVYLDTDVVIYSVEKIEPYWSLLQPMWQAAGDSNFLLVGSELLLLETLVKPIQAGDNELEQIFRQLLLTSAEVQLYPISLPVLEQAIRLRASLNLKSPDAIHAATALSLGCTLFLTNDKVFNRITNLPVTILHQALSE
jgi:predicted nucleic acid-binding protein